MFTEIGTAGERGTIGPRLDPADIEKLIAAARKYRFTILGPDPG